MSKKIKDIINVFGLDELDLDNISIDDLETENVTLVFIGIDASGSMTPYQRIMIDELTKFKNAIIDSKSEDEVLIARADFADNIIIGGYKKIGDLDVNYKTMGATKLFDTILAGAHELDKYRMELKNQGMRVKAVFSIFSDGEDNVSEASFQDAKLIIEDLNNKEIVTAYIAFGPDGLQIGQNLKFKNVLEVGKSESDLRKAINILSKSVVNQSKSVVAKTEDFFTI